MILGVGGDWLGWTLAGSGSDEDEWWVDWIDDLCDCWGEDDDEDRVGRS